MSLDEKRIDELNALCNQFRKDLIQLLYDIQTGHPGGSLSATEIVTTLYFEKMNVSSENFDCQSRDRFVLSKGHAAPMLYLALAERGFFPKEDLKTLRQMGSYLQGHPCAGKTAGVEMSSGPLGLGLSAALGMSLAGKIDKEPYYTYVLMGDGELQEGIVWEAAMSAVKFQADKLIVFIDYNGVQLDGKVDDIMPLGDLKAKWKSFGWNVVTISGHDVEAISDAIDTAKTIKGKPTVIICKTIKGKGVSFMEGKNTWHGKVIGKDEYNKAMKELEVNVNG